MLDQLSATERLRLMQFVCSFAWADLEIRPEERHYIATLIERLDLDEAERTRVRGWLEVPPDPDPLDIPHEHRNLFVAAIRGVIAADGEIAPEEAESLELLQALLEHA